MHTFYIENLSPTAWFTSEPLRPPLPCSGRSVDTKKRTSTFRSQEVPRLEPSDPVSSHLLSPQRRPGLAGAGGAGLAGAGGATPAGTLSCGCWELSLVHLPVRPLRHSPWGAEVGKFAKVSERGSEGTHTGQHCLSCGRTDGQTDERCWEWRGRRLLSPPRPPAQAGGKGRCHGELREGETWRWGPTRWAPEPPPGNPL